jgi:hypothetical protein
MNLAAMKPHPELVSTGYCLANLANGKAEYLIYVPLGEKLTVDLSTIEGTISGEWLNPSDGLVTTGITIAEVGRSSFIPPFEGDAVLYLRSN